MVAPAPARLNGRDRRGTIAACIIAGALTGLADALITFATNPDPAAVPLRIGYALGPVLLGLALGAACGALTAAAHVAKPMAAGVTAIMSLWWLSIVIETWRTGAGVVAVGTIGLGVAVAAIALARLAIDLGRWLKRMGRLARASIVLTTSAILTVAFAITAPSGWQAFRGGTGPCPGVPPAAANAPNILLITVDALRADDGQHMESYRRLAARGTEYLNHITPSPWTLPSIASLLTGLSPDEHGAGRSLSSRSMLAKAPLPATIPTLAQRLGEHGYRTHAIVTNPFLTARYGIDQGFCSFENITMAGESTRGLMHTTVLRFVRVLAPRLLPSDRADIVAAHAARWLDAHKEEPLFLWLHFLDPHAPYGDRDGESTSLTLDLMVFEQERSLGEPFAGIGRVRAGEFRPNAEERARIRELYQQDVAFTDRAIGALLDHLTSRGLLERTAVILTADHGEEFWEHGGVEHGHTLYDEVLHIPLVVSRPHEPSREPRHDMTTVLDLTRTIADTAGLPNKAPTLAETDPDKVLRLSNLIFGEEWTGIRTARLKYMRAEHGEERLFDLAADHIESVNESERDDLRRLLRQAMQSILFSTNP